MTVAVHGQTGVCSVCSHPRFAEIEDALVSGVSQRGTAARFGLNPSSVHRHVDKHLRKRLREAAIRNQATAGADILDRLAEVNRETLGIFRTARRKGNGELALKAAARIEAQLELEGKLIGALRSDPTGPGGNTYVLVFEGGVPKMVEDRPPEPAVAIDTTAAPALPAPTDEPSDDE